MIYNDVERRGITSADTRRAEVAVHEVHGNCISRPDNLVKYQVLRSVLKSLAVRQKDADAFGHSKSRRRGRKRPGQGNASAARQAIAALPGRPGFSTRKGFRLYVRDRENEGRAVAWKRMIERESDSRNVFSRAGLADS